MKAVHMAGLTFGTGAPKICIPLAAPDLPGLEAELSEAKSLPADLYEWRADHFEGPWAPALALLGDRAGRPVLCTLRTRGQGGRCALSPGEYEEAVGALCAAEGVFGLVDIELACGEERVRRLADLAHGRGLGVVALHRGAIVSGAASYAVYDGGMELQVDTAPEYRRRGLAAACAARLMLTCLERDLYPSWDAHTRASLALAEKLGYRSAGEYRTYIKMSSEKEL